MKLFAEILTAFVALEHLYILWMEMFAWTTQGKKTFKSFPDEHFEKTKDMAGNQGLYNGFLAAGLIWSLLISDPAWSSNITIFFLSCVIIAGIYGGATVQRSIFMVQALPAIIGLIFVLIAR
jgi:putative membrane protein